MANPTWQDGSDNWTTGTDWSTGVEPQPGDNVTVASGNPQITTAVPNIGSLVDSSEIDMETGGSLTVTGTVNNSGRLYIDNNYANGGSTLTVDSALTNTGTIQIGPGNQSATVTVNVGSLTNFVGPVTGTINLYGSQSAFSLLEVSAAAGFGVAGAEIGNVSLSGDSQIQFTTGTLNTIRGSLTLNGANASVQDGAAGSTNGALTGVTSIIGTGTLDFESNSNEGDVTLTTTGALSNAGRLLLDNNYAGGGSSLTIGGKLTNTGTVQVGNGGPQSAPTTLAVTSLANFLSTATGTIDVYGGPTTLAALNVGAVAGFGQTGNLIGAVNLFDDGQIQFTGGQITTITGGSELTLNGVAASVLDQNGAQNSALKGLTNVAGTLSMENGNTITTTGALTNSGTIRVDYDQGSNGSTLAIGGALTNTGTLNVGNGFYQGGNSTVTVNGALANFVGPAYGTINVSGSPANVQTGLANESLLSVTAAAGFGTLGSLVGSVNLYDDGVIQFTGGQITTIAANSELTLNGAMASVQDATAAQNDALKGLTSVVGELSIENGNTITTSGSMTNTGTIRVDYDGGSSGSTLMIGGALTTSGTLNVGNGYYQGGNAEVDVGGTLTNFIGTTSGTINVAGSATNSQTGLANQSLLNVNAAAGFGTTGTLVGSVNLYDDGVIQFTTGQITTIAANSQLSLNGAMASVQDSDGVQNDALTGLSTVTGTLYMENGQNVSTSGDMTLTGRINVDYDGGSGGSTLAIGGVLTNSGTLQVGNGNLSKADSVSATGLTNTGTVYLTGSFTNNASIESTLAISGAIVNSGSIIANAESGVSATSYQQTGAGYLSLQIAGTATGRFATLASSGALTIQGGTLHIDDQLGLAAGETFTIATAAAGGLSGVFQRLQDGGTTGDGTVVAVGGLLVGLVYNDAAGTLQLEVVTAPSTTTDNFVASSGSFGVASNWDNGVPTFYSTVVIGASIPSAVTLSQDATIDQLTIDGGSSLTSTGNASLTVGGNVTVQANANLTIGNTGSGTLSIGGSVTDSGTIAVGTGQIDGGLTDNGMFKVKVGPFLVQTSLAGSGQIVVAPAATLSINETVASTFSGVISDGGSGGGNFLVEGTAPLTLTGVSTYTGKTSLSGILDISGAGSIAQASKVSLTAAGATFDISGASSTVSINKLGGVAGSFIDLGAGTLSVNEGIAGTFAGVIQDGGSAGGAGGSLTVAGTKALTLTGVETYTGKTSVSGILDLAGTGSIHSSSKVSLTTAGATLDISGATAGEVINKLGGTAGTVADLGSQNLKIKVQGGTVDTYSGTIKDGGSAGGSGGSLTLGGTGELSLTSANSYTGGTTIAAGTLDIAALGAAGSGTITFANPASNGVATLEIDAAALSGSNGNYSFANAIAGATSTNQVIDLTSLAYVQGSTSATLNGTNLSVTNGSSNVTLHLAATQAKSSFTTASDGNGGTLVYDPPATAKVDTSWIEMAMADFGGVSGDGHAHAGIHDPYGASALAGSGGHADAIVKGIHGHA